MSKNENLCKAILDVRFRYLNIWEPVSINGSGLRYSVGCLINKEDKVTVKRMEKALEAAKEIYISKYGAIDENTFKNPIKDGDMKENADDSFKNSFFLNANCKYNAPEVVNAKVEKITDKSMLTVGDYGKVSMMFYPYNASDGQGVAVLLGNIQFLRKGVPIYDKVSAIDEFEVVKDVEENFLD